MAPSFDCCVKAHFHKGTPVGVEGKLGSFDAYITGPESSDKAILMIADVWGWSLNNTRVLADKYAEGTGSRVYLPDYFHGEDLQQLGKSGKDRSELIPYLLGKYHPRDAQWPISAQSVADIKSTQKSVKKIGAIGYCWGATSVLHLSGKSAGANQVDAVAFAHPSLIEATDFEQLERPGLFMGCQEDGQFPKEKQEASKLVCEKRAKEADVFSRFSYYPRVSHGWSIKGDETEPYSAKAMTHAATEVISFFSLELS